jgi:ABC-2 type transport system permease protein
VLTVRLTSERFIRASVATASRGTINLARRSTAALKFGNNSRSILIVKELRLIGRDPWLLTQLFTQLLYILPLGAMLWRKSTQGMPWGWLLGVFLAGSIAGSLAWLTVCAEDVPELLASSPMSTLAIVRAKLTAALIPVLALILLPLTFLWREHLWFGICLVICSAGNAISCALLTIRNPVQAKRGDFKTRHRTTPGSGLLEAAVCACWVGVCFLLVRFGV